MMKVSLAETTAISLQQDLWFAFLGQEKFLWYSQREKCPSHMQFCKACFILKWFNTLLSHFNCCLSCSTFFRKLYCWNSAWFQICSSSVQIMSWVLIVNIIFFLTVTLYDKTEFRIVRKQHLYNFSWDPRKELVWLLGSASCSVRSVL